MSVAAWTYRIRFENYSNMMVCALRPTYTQHTFVNLSSRDGDRHRGKTYSAARDDRGHSPLASRRAIAAARRRAFASINARPQAGHRPRFRQRLRAYAESSTVGRSKGGLAQVCRAGQYHRPAFIGRAGAMANGTRARSFFHLLGRNLATRKQVYCMREMGLWAAS
jgi:hypothetical protein